MHILSCLQGTEWIPSGVARGGKVQLPRLLTQEEQNHPHTHTNPTLTCWETENGAYFTHRKLLLHWIDMQVQKNCPLIWYLYQSQNNFFPYQCGLHPSDIVTPHHCQK